MTQCVSEGPEEPAAAGFRGGAGE